MLRGDEPAAEDTTCELSSKNARKLLPVELHRRARIWLAVLDAASSWEVLLSLGLELEKIRGDHNGQRSIRINDQYRICFFWNNDTAVEVKIVDYH